MDVSIADLLRGRAHVSATPPDAKSEYSRGQGPSDLIAQLLSWRRPPVHPGFSAALRTGILTATLNAASLIIIGGYIIYESIDRIINPPEVEGWAVIIVAAVASTINAGRRGAGTSR